MDKWIRNPGWTWVQKAFLIAFLDGLIILAAYLMALLLRFDFIFSRIPREYVEGYIWSMPYLDRYYDRSVLWSLAVSSGVWPVFQNCR